MAPSSAYASAPKKVSTPVRLHTPRIKLAEGRLRATALGTRKIAEPITVPIRIAVASTRPSLRGSSAFCMSGKANPRREVRASFERSRLRSWRRRGPRLWNRGGRGQSRHCCGFGRRLGNPELRIAGGKFLRDITHPGIQGEEKTFAGRRHRSRGLQHRRGILFAHGFADGPSARRCFINGLE